MPGHRITPEDVQRYLKHPTDDKHFVVTDVLIAGSGPVGATYARTIIDEHPDVKVTMVEIGSQDNEVIGGHHKNSIKYQKDIDAFVSIIRGALQPLSVPMSETHISTLGGDAWRPERGEVLAFHGTNPNQDPMFNLKGSAITRTVGGMATHWTCACPIPHEEERVLNPIPWEELSGLLEEGRKYLNVNDDQFDHSIRHQVVRDALQELGQERVRSLPLAVKRREDNCRYVTWSGTNTVLGDVVKNPNFELLAEHQVIAVFTIPFTNRVAGAFVRNLNTNHDCFILAKAVVICCGAVATPQILYNSKIVPAALGRYLCEQSLAFCQIVLKKEIVDNIEKDPRFEEAVKEHQEKYPDDPLPIPFSDPEPQIMLPYSSDFPYHVQIHRDAFSYGDVWPRADPRVVVDLRFFGKQEVQMENFVSFGNLYLKGDWNPGVTDIYGMPQPTFHVQRSQTDRSNDHKMMNDMTMMANMLGAFLPGSYPQFMEPGLALHITGTTRIGTDPDTSVADPESKVHGFENLWVGGNGCIPDSTACNPTLTSVAIAIKGARSVIQYLLTRN